MGIYISSSGHSKIVLTSQKETKTCFYIQHLKATLQVLTAEIYTVYTLINVFLSLNGQSLPVIFLRLHSQFMKRIWKDKSDLVLRNYTELSKASQFVHFDQSECYPVGYLAT